MDDRIHASYLSDLDYFQAQLESTSNPFLYLPVAMLNLRMGNFAEAITFCNAGIKVNPTYHHLNVIKSEALINMGRKDEAREMLYDIVMMDEDNFKALKLLGLICKTEGDKQSAIMYLRAAFIKASEDLELLTWLEELGGFPIPTMKEMEEAAASTDFTGTAHDNLYTFDIDSAIGDAKEAISDLMQEMNEYKEAGKTINDMLADTAAQELKKSEDEISASLRGETISDDEILNALSPEQSEPVDENAAIVKTTLPEIATETIDEPITAAEDLTSTMFDDFKAAMDSLTQTISEVVAEEAPREDVIADGYQDILNDSEFIAEMEGAAEATEPATLIQPTEMLALPEVIDEPALEVADTQELVEDAALDEPALDDSAFDDAIAAMDSLNTEQPTTKAELEESVEETADIEEFPAIDMLDSLLTSDELTDISDLATAEPVEDISGSDVDDIADVLQLDKLLDDLQKDVSSSALYDELLAEDEPAAEETVEAVTEEPTVNTEDIDITAIFQTDKSEDEISAALLSGGLSDEDIFSALGSGEDGKAPEDGGISAPPELMLTEKAAPYEPIEAEEAAVEDVVSEESAQWVPASAGMTESGVNDEIPDFTPNRDAEDELAAMYSMNMADGVGEKLDPDKLMEEEVMLDEAEDTVEQELALRAHYPPPPAYPQDSLRAPLASEGEFSEVSADDNEAPQDSLRTPLASEGELVDRPQDVDEINGRRAERLNAEAAYHSTGFPDEDKAACAELGAGRTDGAKITDDDYGAVIDLQELVPDGFMSEVVAASEFSDDLNDVINSEYIEKMRNSSI